MREVHLNFGDDSLLASRKQSARFAVGSIELPGTEEPDFNAFFRHVPGVFVATDPEFTIAAASDDMLRKTFTWREPIDGRNLFDVFPDNPSTEPPGGVTRLKRLLRDVQVSGTTNSMSVMRYDIQDRTGGEGAWIEKYWTFISRPLVDRYCKAVLYVLTEVRDVTRIVQLALWMEPREEMAHLAPEIQRTLQRIQEDVMSPLHHRERVRAQVAEEMRATGATPQLLVGELNALLRSTDNRLYSCAGEWVTESGVYVAYHRGGCTFAPRVRFLRQGVQFPSCDRCGNDVLYRLSRTLS